MCILQLAMGEHSARLSAAETSGLMLEGVFWFLDRPKQPGFMPGAHRADRGVLWSRQWEGILTPFAAAGRWLLQSPCFAWGGLGVMSGAMSGGAVLCC